MYIETVSDGLLKSIGEESRVFRYGLYNSALRLISILLFMRSTGEMGYIALLIISNTFSFLLCYGRLKRVSGMKLSLLGEFIFPALCTFGESFAVSVLFAHLSSARWGIMKIVMSVCLYVPVALWVLYSGGEKNKSD